MEVYGKTITGLDPLYKGFATTVGTKLTEISILRMINETVSSKRYTLASAPIENSDQNVHRWALCE